MFRLLVSATRPPTRGRMAPPIMAMQSRPEVAEADSVARPLVRYAAGPRGV